MCAFTKHQGGVTVCGSRSQTVIHPVTSLIDDSQLSLSACASQR